MNDNIPKWLQENVPEDVYTSGIFRFSFSLPGRGNISIDLTQDIDIDYDLLEHTLESMPAQYMYWSAVYSELKSQCSVLEDRIQRRRAFLYKSVTDRYRQSNVKITNAQIESIVESDSLTEDDVRMAVAIESQSPNVDIEELIKQRYENEKKLTLEYLKAQLLVAKRNTGKVFYMVRAIEMRSEHCRSLAGFKRQDKEQSSSLT